MERRFKGIGNVPAYLSTSAAKVVRLMAAGMVLTWLLFFLWFAIAAFFFITVSLASGAIIAPIVALILFLTGNPVFGEGFAWLGLGIPLALGICGAIGGSFGVLTENDSARKAVDRVSQTCRKIAGMQQPAKRGHRY